MDYVRPAEVVIEAVEVARTKAQLPISAMLVRGMLAGAFLGYATSLAIMTTSQGLPPIVGAILFPAGFVMLVLLGLELATGNFALLPMGAAAGTVRWRDLGRNWFWVYVGNLAGCLLYAGFFYLAITNCGTTDGGALAAQVKQIAQKKTLAYMPAGGAGWMTAVIKGILCNWMVTVGAVMALISRSAIGKTVAMWLPIFIFFALGYEHSIVNMFVIPSGMMLGAPVSLRTWWLWNQVPVTIGNIAGGVLFTGLPLYLAHRMRPGAATAQAPEPALVLGQEPELAS